MFPSLDRASFRSAAARAKLVTFAFVPYTAAVAYMAMLLVQGVGLANGLAHGRSSPADIQAFAGRFDGMTMPTYAFYALGIVAFCMWAHRVAKNAVAFGEPVDSPGWTVASFFIPVVLLWAPLQSLSKIWIHSDPAGPAEGEHWTQRAHRAPRYFAAWWITWLVARVLWRITEWEVKTIHGPEDWASALTLGVVASGFEIAALILMFAVVWSITRRQEQRGAGLPRAAIV
jgi:hypothetical protein